MLVLSRKVDERIFIGDDICIRVTTMTGSRVGIAIDAPREVAVIRGELKHHCTPCLGEESSSTGTR